MRPGILLHSLHCDCGRFGLISQPLWPWEPQEIIQYLIVHWWYFFLGATPEKINALPSVLGLFVLLCHGATVWRLHSCTTVIWDSFLLYHIILTESRDGGTTGTGSQMPPESPILQKPKTETALVLEIFRNIDTAWLFVFFFSDCLSQDYFFAQSNTCYTMFCYTEARNQTIRKVQRKIYYMDPVTEPL